MTVTSNLFEAYLKCPTKCFLLAIGETATRNEYADWVQTQKDAYQREGSRHLAQGVAPDECVTSPGDAKKVISANWRLAIDHIARAQNSESTIHAVERMPSEVRNRPAQFIAIRFIFTNKLGRNDKLLLAFDALVLSETLDREAALGKIIHGDDFVILKVKTPALKSEVGGITAKIATLISDKKPPDLVLNRHCPECEFRDRCRQKAIETDDLSLLAGITEDERYRHRSKGIFTVTQLSYTFRPRRTPKRAKNPARPRYPALQALAIREKTVFIHGSPKIPTSKAQVYLDIEGIPDSDSYYLIGALIVSEGQETFQSFWAAEASQESEIFVQFAEAVANLPDSQILHFGDYETVALRRIKARLPESLRPKIDAILERMTNVLSVIHPHVYFPTYSNGLKDIGRFLGFVRVDGDATGLQSIIWRKAWNANRAPDIKGHLLQYNQDDCRTLKHIVEFIGRLTSPDSATGSVSQIPCKTAQTEDLIKERPRWEMFRPREYFSEDLKKVAKCAYFDYQREKIYVRTHPHLKVVNKKHRKFRRGSIRINKVESIESQRCPQCQSKKVQKGKQLSHELIDLKFFNGGVKKWITRTLSWRYCCSRCKRHFSSEERSPNPQRYGHGIVTWCVYQNVACGVNMLQTKESLKDVFGLTLPDCQAYRWTDLCSEILRSILNSPVIHIDETTSKLKKQRGYVWVMRP
jgi:predicted RecB family nuclease